MRRPKAELRARVNGQLRLRYERRGMTSYAGLEFLRRFLHGAGWVRTLRQELTAALPPTDFGVVGMPPCRGCDPPRTASGSGPADIEPDGAVEHAATLLGFWTRR